jgi:hypothetical protein
MMKFTIPLLAIVFYCCTDTEKQSHIDSDELSQLEKDSLFVGVRYADILGGSERSHIEEIKGQNGLPTEFSYLKIKGDSAFLDRGTVLLLKGDTIPLKNDGICHYFRGTVQRQANKIHFLLDEVVVNYFEAKIKIDKNGARALSRCQVEFDGEISEKEFLGERLIVTGQRLTIGGKFVPYYIEFVKRPSNRKLVSEKTK